MIQLNNQNENQTRGLKAVVLGSIGVIGKVIARLLCESNKWVEVSVIVRSLDEWQSLKGFQKLKIIQVESLDELQETQKWNQFAGYDAFFCTLASRSKAGKDEFLKVDYTYCLWGAKIAEHNTSISQQKEIPHFSLLSGTGADPNSQFQYHKTKGQIEQAVKELNFRYCSIFQPGLIQNRENNSSFCCCCGFSGIDTEDCAKAMQFESEGRFSSNNEKVVRNLTFSNEQMNIIAKEH